MFVCRKRFLQTGYSPVKIIKPEPLKRDSQVSLKNLVRKP